MSPKPQIETASMLTALYCVTMIQAEIHQLFQGRACNKHNFGQTSSPHALLGLSTSIIVSISSSVQFI